MKKIVERGVAGSLSDDKSRVDCKGLNCQDRQRLVRTRKQTPSAAGDFHVVKDRLDVAAWENSGSEEAQFTKLLPIGIAAAVRFHGCASISSWSERCSVTSGSGDDVMDVATQRNARELHDSSFVQCGMRDASRPVPAEPCRGWCAHLVRRGLCGADVVQCQFSPATCVPLGTHCVS